MSGGRGVLLALMQHSAAACHFVRRRACAFCSGSSCCPWAAGAVRCAGGLLAAAHVGQVGV